MAVESGAAAAAAPVAKEAAAPVAAAAAAEGVPPPKVDLPDRDAFERKVQALKDFMKANKAEKDAIQKRIEGNKSPATSGAAVSDKGAGAILGHVFGGRRPSSPPASPRALIPCHADQRPSSAHLRRTVTRRRSSTTPGSTRRQSSESALALFRRRASRSARLESRPLRARRTQPAPVQRTCDCIEMLDSASGPSASARLSPPGRCNSRHLPSHVPADRSSTHRRRWCPS